MEDTPLRARASSSVASPLMQNIYIVRFWVTILVHRALNAPHSEPQYAVLRGVHRAPWRFTTALHHSTAQQHFIHSDTVQQ